MDIAGFEPVLAIPVILVVVGAVLVYMFGFQQGKEPSHEHLAVLQSSTSFKGRAAPTNNPKPTRTTSAPAQSKPKANGHIANGSANKAKSAPAANKDNKPVTKKVVVPQKPKDNVRDPSNKPEDFESGEWIPAVTRKDKIKKPKEAPASPGKRAPRDYKGKEVVSDASAAVPIPTSVTSSPGKAPRIEDVIKEMQERQNTSAPASPEKKQAPAPAPAPAKGKKGAVKEEAAPAAVPPPKEEKAAPPAAETEEKVVKAKDLKANIAFDEMGGGDTWEEAKSRGAKKRRARKD